MHLDLVLFAIDLQQIQCRFHEILKNYRRIFSQQNLCSRSQ
nr:MAG TPA: hypothetical protein [Bacteriophage sp.]